MHAQVMLAWFSDADRRLQNAIKRSETSFDAQDAKKKLMCVAKKQTQEAASSLGKRGSALTMPEKWHNSVQGASSR